jgi:hypothetical protein
MMNFIEINSTGKSETKLDDRGDLFAVGANHLTMADRGFLRGNDVI